MSGMENHVSVKTGRLDEQQRERQKYDYLTTYV